MGWIKVGDGVYQKVESTETVNVQELQQELAEIENKMNEIRAQFKPIPENAEEWLIEAIDLYNQTVFGPQLAELEIRKKEIERILQEINNGD